MNKNEEKRIMWESRIKDYRSSNLTVTNWCEAKGYKVKNFVSASKTIL